MVSELLKAFALGAGPDAVPPDGWGAEDAGVLDELIAGARADLADIIPLDDAFAHRLGCVVAADSEQTLRSLASLSLSDLYLATACADGDPAAIARLRATYFGDAVAALRAWGVAEADRDEVLQRVFHELLVAPPGRQARICTYSGRGALRRWLRSVSVRIAARTRRASAREAPLEDAVLDGESGGDPELEHLRNEYGATFKAAFEASLSALAVRDRNLLRQYFVDGLTIDVVGGLYGVHRSTAARWVAAARKKVLDGVADRMTRELGLKPDEMLSVLRLVRSRLDLSLGHALGASDTATA